MKRKIISIFLALVLLCSMSLATAVPAGAVTIPASEFSEFSGWYCVNYGGNFYVSTSAIEEAKAVSKIQDDQIHLETLEEGEYTDAGVALYTDGSLTLDKLETIVVKATGDIYAVNLWFDKGGDGEFFAFDIDGKMTGTDGDIYGQFGSPSDEGAYFADESSTVSFLSGEGSYTLAELKAGAKDGITRNTKVSLWIGISGDTPKTTDIDAVYVNGPSETWVDDDWTTYSRGDSVEGHLFGIDAFANIQDAINVTNEGGTVNVAAGIYKENVQNGTISPETLGKKVNLVGTTDASGNPLPTIQGSVLYSLDSDMNDNIRIENINFVVDTNTILRLYGVNGATIKNCTFDGGGRFSYTGNPDGAWLGIVLERGSSNGNSDVLIDGCTFENGLYGAIQGYVSGLTVENCTITNVSNGINHQGGSNLEVKDTDIDVIARSASDNTYAIRFGSSTVTNMTVDGGSISVDYNGLTPDSGVYFAAIVIRNPAAGTLKANNLSIDGEVINFTTTNLDATNNWWGDGAGPYHYITNPEGTGGQVSDNVGYSPWLGAEPGTAPMTWVVNETSSIQDAINEARPGDTIQVAAGRYVGRVDITESVILRSMDGPETTIIEGSPGDYYIVNVKADNVKIDGFTITAPLYTGTADASGITTGLEGRTSNLRITNSIIHSIGADNRSIVSFGSFGINVWDIDGIEIDNNTIYNIHHAATNAWANGIMVWGNNEATSATNVYIHDNNIYDISTPEHVNDAAIYLSSYSENVTVENNIIENTSHCGIKVRTDLGTTIAGNTISDCYVGLELYRGNVSVTGNQISGSETAGIWMTGNIAEVHIGSEGSQEDANTILDSTTRDIHVKDATGPAHIWAENVYDSILLEGANTQIFVHVPAGQPDAEVVVEGTGEVDVPDADTSVSYNTTGPATITTQKLAEEDVAETTFGTVGKYVDVMVPAEDAANVNELEIRVYYTLDEIAGLDEDSLIMYWYDGTDWRPCSNTGVNTDDKYIWAIIDSTTSPNLTQMTGTPFALGASISFEKPYYGVGDEITITIGDDGANNDPIRLDSITVRTTSTRDTVGIEVTLREIGIDTGIFTGSFTTTAALPPPSDVLGVKDGEVDTVTVSYDGAPPVSATVIVDDEAPVITVVSPGDGTTITEAQPTIEAALSDGVGSGIDEESIVMTLDSEPVEHSYDSGTLTYIPTAPLADGEYTVIVTVTDMLGHPAEETWSFTIDTTSPGITNLSPEDGDFVNDNQPQISATITGADIDEDSIVMTLDSVLVEHSYDSGALTYTPAAPLAEGEHTVTINVDDLAGNPAAEASWAFTVDVTDPVITIGVLPEAINEETLDIAGTYDETNLEEITLTVNGEAALDAEGNLITITTAGDDWTTDAAVALTEGNNEIAVTITDKAGNEGSDTVNILRDTTPPEIAGYGSDPEFVAAATPTDVTFFAAVTDELSDIALVTIDLSPLGGEEDEEMTYNDETERYEYFLEDLELASAAPVILTITAVDALNNKVEVELTLNPDEEAPQISGAAIEYPFGLDSARPGDEVIITATVIDDVLVDSVSAECDAFDGTVTLTPDGESYTGTATVVRGMAQGSYDLTITATDAAGNQTVETLTLEVVAGITGYELNLVSGWNLISLPIIPDNPNISEIISDANLASGDVSSIGIIWGYNAATGEFSYYNPAAGTGDLDVMKDGYGYWVFMESNDYLTVTGRENPEPPAAPPTYSVAEGWNLIGFKSLVDMIDYDAETDSGYLSNIKGTYPVLWTFDPVTKEYTDIKGMGIMKVGHGFWLWAREAGVIVPTGAFLH